MCPPELPQRLPPPQRLLSERESPYELTLPSAPLSLYPTLCSLASPSFCLSLQGLRGSLAWLSAE